MTKRRLLLCLLSSTLLASPVEAFPSSVGSCPTSAAAVSGSHLIRPEIETGSLLSSGIDVQIGSLLLDPAAPVFLAPGEDHTITVTGDPAFRGFLILLGGAGTGALSVENATNTQIASLCTSAGLSGVSHNNNNFKPYVSTIFNIPIPITLTLDITIVVENRGSRSEYYYTGYTIVIDPAAQTTSAPVMAPALVQAPNPPLPPSPGFPVCFVCGEGMAVTRPDAVLTITGQDPISCGFLEQTGLNGFIDEASCSLIGLEVLPCFCDFITMAPVAAPVTMSNIVEIAVANNLTTLVAAVQAANLTDTLATGGPFTVFAPTDAAFALLGTNIINGLLANPAELTQILLYHVVAGTVLSSDLMPGEVPTLQGDNITVTLDSENAFLLNGNVRLLLTNVTASNGVVHVIDMVLTPPVPMPSASPTNSLPNIVEVAVSNNFTTLVTAVQAANLTDTLATGGPFTVFAPTDAAFALLGTETINALLAAPQNLTNILLYHVVGGTITSAEFLSGSIPTLLGENITVSFGMFEEIFLNGNTRLLNKDVMASNGIVHTIDMVLIPPSIFPPTPAPITPMPTLAPITPMPTLAPITPMPTSAPVTPMPVTPAPTPGPTMDPLPPPTAILPLPNLFQAAEINGLTSLTAALEIAGLDETIASGGPFTVFAPTDAAFALLGDETLDGLLANPDMLALILLYHVVNGIVFLNALMVGEVPTLLEGANITVTQDAMGNFLLNGNSTLVITDIQASNGVLHVIDMVLTPPAQPTPQPTPMPSPIPTPMPTPMPTASSATMFLGGVLHSLGPIVAMVVGTLLL